jgi:hypothetical protein
MRFRRVVGAALPLLLVSCRLGHAPAAEVQLTLTGGSNPGVYQAEADQPACSRDLLGRGSWGVQLTDWKGPKAGLRSLQLVVPADTLQDQFYLGVVFGDFFTGIAREIETRPDSPRPKGHGHVTVDSSPAGATFRVDGVTQDSVAIQATIACHMAQATKEGSR